MSDYTDDAYAILGVKVDATEKEIKTAYRKLALLHHPDRQSYPAARDKATSKFAEIAHAYEILSDEFLRAEYNNSRTPTVSPSYSAPSKAGGSPKNNNNTGSSGSPAPFRYHFSDPYEVFKRDFREQFGIDYPGAKYDWVDFDTPTAVPKNGNALPMIANGNNPGTTTTAPKKGFHLFRRKQLNGENSKEENQLVVRAPTSAGNQLANPSSSSTAIVLVEKKNNRPISMDVTTSKDGPVTTTVTVMTRPDGSTEKVTMRTGIPGKAPGKPSANLPQLTNGDRDNQKMLPPSSTKSSGKAAPGKGSMLQLTNGPGRAKNNSNNSNNSNVSNSKNNQKMIVASGNERRNPSGNKSLMLGNGGGGPSTALVPKANPAAVAKPQRKLLGWGGNKQ